MYKHVDLSSAAAALEAIEQLDVDALRLFYRVECPGEDLYNQQPMGREARTLPMRS